jgi:hypothetical protein
MSRLFNALPTADAILVSTSADTILVFAGPRLALVYRSMMILLLLFLQKQSLAFAVYLFGIGTLLQSLAHSTVARLASGDALYPSAPAHIQMQTPWTGDCIPRITFYGFWNCEHSSH